MKTDENIKIRKTDIAVIGMSGRFPGANDTTAFWELIKEGKESITFYSKEELLGKGVNSELLNNPAYVPADSIIESADKFDSSFFGYTPREADFMDPQHRVFLEECYSALENAGYDPEKYRGEVGVFAGCSRNNYWLKNLSQHNEVLSSLGELQTIVNNDKDFLTTRVSYKLNLKGPSVDIQSACSTSLVAIHFACQSLLTNQCDMALGGGVFVKTPRGEGYLFKDGSIDSPDGHCYPFDKEAGGTVFGEGAGVVVLKRLEDAIKDRDSIISVIKSTAINNDGSLKVGYMAPGVTGQANVISKAVLLSEIEPETIGYIETHGTGTKMGDPIEIEALTRVYSATTGKKQYCAIGSVKANIGHLDTAAGVAGLISASLVLKYREFPPLLNFTSQNPELHLEKTPFYVNRELKAWERSAYPRRAAVSSFGIGGTNSHAILEEWIPELSVPSSKRFHLLPISAKSDSVLQKMYQNLTDHLGKTSDRVEDIAFTLQNGRKEFRSRGMLIWDNAASEDSVFSELPYFRGTQRLSEPRTIFMFTGQGSQYTNMIKGLYDHFDTVKTIIDYADTVLKEKHQINLVEVLFSNREEDRELLNQTSVAQPALFTAQFAVASLLMEYGIRPSALTGHSIGEITAACLSGVFAFEDALNLVAWRGRIMQNQVQGSMLSVNLPKEKVSELLSNDVEIALNNAPNFCVISGTFEAVDQFEKKLLSVYPDCRLTRLKTSHAFHSKLMEPAIEPFLEILRKIQFGGVNIPFISNVTGTWITKEEASSPKYWASHIRSMVNFSDGISELLKNENNLFVEVGPGNSLSVLLSQYPSKNRITTLTTVRHPKQGSNDVEFFFRTVAGYWLSGGTIDWNILYSDEERFRVPLPTYPFERTRHWIDPKVQYSYELTAGNKSVYNILSPETRPPINGHKVVSEEFFHNRPSLENSFVPASTGIEKRISQIWGELLGINHIGITDDFFLLGGHSLLATQIINRINEEFNTRLTMEKFFKSPTIKGLSDNETFSGKLDTFPDEIIITDYSSELPLSKSQERLWIVNQIDGNNPAYNISFAYILSGPLDNEVFRKSIEMLSHRQKVLRSYFGSENGTPVGHVDNKSSVQITEADFSEFSQNTLDDEIQKFIEKESNTLFDILNGPLYRISLVNLGGARTLFHFTVHHLVFDGWSWGIFTKELQEIYNNLISGSEYNPLPLLIDYYGYIGREKTNRETKLNSAREYWKKKLYGIPGQINFPTDFKRKDTLSGLGGRVPVNIPKEITDLAKEFSIKENVTMYMYFLSVFGYLLSRYSGDKDICIGTPVANRPGSKLEKLIGLFINSIVLRVQIDEELSFRELLKKVKETSLEALSNQELPFEDLVEALRPERIININPIFQVMFAWQNLPSSPLTLKGVTSERIVQKDGASPFDLTFYAWEENGTVSGEFEFSKDILKRETIETFKDNFNALLSEILLNPDLPLKNISILSESEKERICEFNNTKTIIPDLRLHNLFEEAVKMYPQNEAVVNLASGNRLTFSNLDAKANQLASYLRLKNFTIGSVAGISVERSEWMIIAVLGVLKAGGTYLPLDPVFPDDRLLYMLEDSGATFLLTEERFIERFSTVEKTMILLDSEKSSIEKEPAEPVSSEVSADSIAYMIYTSGSTGNPKGVRVHHSAIVNFISSMKKTPGLTNNDRLLAITTLSFDISLLELFLPLSQGATIYLAQYSHVTDGTVLAKILDENEITVMQATPTTWTILLGSGWNGRTSLKALCGGEPLQASLVRDLIGKVGALWNMYGPTETTVWSSCEQITDLSSILVGKPIDNTQFHILHNNQEQPVGVTGELCIGGAGVSKGYHNREELNREKFIIYNDELVYRTGDLGRYLDNGKVELFGRTDNQIKLRGYRIEPGEIEFQLSQIPGVKEAVVKTEKFDEQDIRLIGYLNVNDSFNLERSQIVKAIEPKLPAYMIPSLFQVMKDFPRTLNGKIDRKKLNYLTEFTEPDVVEDDALSEQEQYISLILQDVLKVNILKRDANFFDLGGNSLLAVSVINKIKEKTGYSLTFRDFLENSSVSRLSKLIESRTGKISSPVNLVHLTGTEHLPLTINQKRLWLISKLQPDLPLYIIQYTYMLKGYLNLNIFKESLKLLFKRHNIVFTVIQEVNGEPFGAMVPGAVEITTIDYSDLTGEEQKRKIDELVSNDSKIPFSLENGPLYRLFLITTSPEENYFHMSIHHTIFDGWSWSVLVKELKKIYNSLLHDSSIDLEENEFHLFDYAEWERTANLAGKNAKSIEFWKENLRDSPATLNFPYDFQRRERPSGRGRHVEIRLTDELSEKLRTISRDEGTSLFTTLLGIYAMQLRRYSGEDDLNIGMAVAHRPHSKLENIFGMLVNTVVVRMKFGKDESFRSVMHKSSNASLNAMAHQDVSFESIVEIVNPERLPNINPIFQAAFVWQKDNELPVELEGITSERITASERTTPFDLTLYLWETDGVILGEIEYAADLLSHETMIRFRDNLMNLIRTVIDNSQVPVDSLSLVSQEEVHLIDIFNDTKRDYPGDKTIIELFEEQVTLFPDKTALVFKDKSFTYSELNGRSNQLARTLRIAGVKDNTTVGLLSDKSADLIVGILAILKAGGAYVPIDPEYPVDRINFISSDSGCKLLLTHKRHLDIPVEGVTKLCIDDENAYNNDSSNLACIGTSASLAYIMYTSGTTGKPKGSLIPQYGVVRLVRSINYMELTSADRILLTGAIVFDATTFEIWGALLNGGTLYVVEKETLLNPKVLVKELHDNDITILWLTSALFTQIAEARPDIFGKLKYLLSGGDVLSASHINRVRSLHPQLKVINCYGPTENSTFSSTYLIEKDFASNIPIGKPIANSTTYIFDRYMNYQPIGIIGELYVGGDGLSLGYINRDDLNAVSFIEHPFKPGERLYKTGDYARWLPDGNIEFHGRIDNQLKINGFRVELGEIEAVISTLDGVIETVVKPVKIKEGDKRLVAFLNVQDSFNMDLRTLNNMVKERLPAYLVPSFYKLMHGFPSTINGKTDRGALKIDVKELVRSDTDDNGSFNPDELIIYNIWCEALKTKNIAVTDNFFEIGGNSLLAISVFAKIESAFGIDMGLRVFFDSPTIRDMAEAIQIAIKKAELKEQISQGEKTDLKMVSGEI
jgi:amino acid adenylation domain-containing protein